MELSGQVDGGGSLLIGEIAYALQRGEGFVWGCIHQVRPPGSLSGGESVGRTRFSVKRAEIRTGV